MWLRDSLQDITFAQLPFALDQLTKLAALMYEDLMVGTCIVAAAVSKLHEVCLSRVIIVEETSDRSCFQIVQHRARSALQSIERRLVESIKVCPQPSLNPDADISWQAAWYKDPRLFFFPHHWRNHENLLRAILQLSGGSDDMRQFQAVRARNLRALCYRKQPNLGVSVLEKARNEALIGLQVSRSLYLRFVGLNVRFDST
jgi:hypothetical protein